MLNKLRLLAGFSILLLGITFFWSDHEVDQMMAFDQTDASEGGVILNRKRVDGFKINKLTRKRTTTNEKRAKKKNESEQDRLIAQFSKDIESISQTCVRKYQEVLADKDLIDPNAELYKRPDHVISSLYEIAKISNQAYDDIEEMDYDFQQKIENVELSKYNLEQLVQIYDSKMDLCRDQNVDNFIMTALESFSLNKWPEDSKVQVQGFISLYTYPMFHLNHYIKPMYRGLGLIRNAMVYGAFQDLDKDYVEEMHFMLEERTDELKYQFQKEADIATKTQILKDEFEWRKDFSSEVNEYISANL